MVAILFAAVALSFCSKPTEPSVEPQVPGNVSNQIQAIQSETEREAKQVTQMARSQVGPDVEKALKAFAMGPGSGGNGESLDGGELARATDEIAGKLERATPGFVIIRDGAGFAYWLRTSDNTQVTQNGQPARVTDFRQGADVRASYAWQGKERIATEVEILSGQVLDGGVDGGS